MILAMVMSLKWMIIMEHHKGQHHCCILDEEVEEYFLCNRYLIVKFKQLQKRHPILGTKEKY